jgi:hypothetical protein
MFLLLVREGVRRRCSKFMTYWEQRELISIRNILDRQLLLAG